MASRLTASIATICIVGLSILGTAVRPPTASADPDDISGLSQSTPCSATWLHPDLDVVPGEHLEYLGIRDTWRFATGKGQTIAVIDTGVAPHPRLPKLRGGGDLVSDSDGTADCDAHGTLIAGLIAATPSADGFAGVAPNAEIVSIRHSSGKFSRSPSGSPEPARSELDGSGTVTSLARAITLAAESGARVINISEVACVPRGTLLDDAALSAAVHDAVLERDIAIIAASGNVDGACSGSNPASPPPQSTPVTDPLDAVATIASPAWYDDLVLTVGSVDIDGNPSDFSLPGPWVDVAAPGERLASLSIAAPGDSGQVPELATAVVDADDTVVPIEGSSFAAPLVAGLAALIRERFPALTAPQIYERITRTATGGGHGEDWRIGAGIVDPLAALTAPSGSFRQGSAEPVSIIAGHGSPDDREARAVGLTMATVAGAVALFAAMGVLFRMSIRGPLFNRPRARRSRVDREESVLSP